MRRIYHVRPHTDRYSNGFLLYLEERSELVLVPEAEHILFRTEAEAWAFAEEMEQSEPEEMA